ncbi:MAG: amidohydrolase family protein [Oscillospiraceae bacterium]|nr:amidohydrolase family protein [Oscillospiraceae bacterium]
MLYECHAHIMLDGVSQKDAQSRHANGPDESWVRAKLEEYKAADVRYIRDGGDKFGVSVLAARIAGEYGITFRTPCFAIHRKGRYGNMLGRAYETMDEYRALVDEVKGQGGDFVKIMATGILDFNEYGKLTSEPLGEAELTEMVRIAHGEGFAVMAHCNGADNIKAAVAAGVDSIEHGFYADEQALSDLAASGTVLVPTFAPICNLIGSGLFPDDVLRRIAEQHALDLARLIYIGGAAAPGSDAGAMNVLHGVGIKDEYGYMKAAVSEDALREGEGLIELLFQRR